MPKQTFFNLPPDKKEILIKAALKEFSRVPLFEASISNIIQEAGIARGSFYQYFEDKEDIYLYLLEQKTKRFDERFISILKKQNGNLIQTYIELFPITLKRFQNIERRNFFRNTFLNMNYKVQNRLSKYDNEEKVNQRYLEIIGLIDTTKLNITEEQDVLRIMKILRVVTLNNLIRSFAKEMSIEESIEEYTLEINLLKKGLCKEE